MSRGAAVPTGQGELPANWLHGGNSWADLPDLGPEGLACLLFNRETDFDDVDVRQVVPTMKKATR